MGPLATLQKLFGFTRNEIRALLFLSSTFLAGLGIRWYQEGDPQTTPSQFDYSVQDSVFHARSSAVLAETTAGKPAARKKAKKSPARHSIDINTASKDELMLLPGIGETYAERIVIDRQDHGPFRSVDDLTRVKGIGTKTLARIREFIRPIEHPDAGKEERKDPPDP